MSEEDILLWPDGKWCYVYEYHYLCDNENDYYAVVPFGSDEHVALLEKACGQQS